MTFSQYDATKTLQFLAKNPFNLNGPSTLTPQRMRKYIATACGYKLIFGTERVTDDVIATLSDLAKEAKALEKMKEMQSGAAINKIEGFPSEQRSVLHTATRDFFEDKNSSPLAVEAAAQAYAEIEKLKQFLVKIGDRYTDLVLIGIGGSDLGPRAHYLALEYLQKGRKAHFISNIDPEDAELALRGLDLSRTLVVVVSKTGTTLETATNEALVRSKFVAKGLNPKEHFVSVSMAKSPLDDPDNYLERFYIWDWVGGRYSTTSMVGGVLLAFVYGFDTFWEFLKGANAMDKAAMRANIFENLPLLTALLGIWNRNFLKYPTVAIIPYTQALHRFPAHIQQLDMESNGKRIDKNGHPVDFETGPIIWGEPGTNAQHSFYQLIHQGTDTVPLELIGYRQTLAEDDFIYQGTSSNQKLLANLFAQMIALATGQTSGNPNKLFPGNRPTHLLLGEKLTPYALGVLLAFYEHKVAFQGFIWNINSFDQEGVQLGKVVANKIINHFKDAESEPFPLVDLFLEE